jgi:hypothetical protein
MVVVAWRRCGIRCEEHDAAVHFAAGQMEQARAAQLRSGGAISALRE